MIDDDDDDDDDDGVEEDEEDEEEAYEQDEKQPRVFINVAYISQSMCRQPQNTSV